MSNVTEEFSRFAHQYDQHNIIQAKVAKILVDKLPLNGYNRVLDIGCGSGEVFKNLKDREIHFSELTAFDSSSPMLEIHPTEENVIKVCADFNDKNFLNILSSPHYDLLISSSALQWSSDLDFTLEKLSSLSKRFHAAIFTSGTFKTLHNAAHISSPIYSAQTLQEKMLKHYTDVSFELHHFTLSFDSTREMFKYIKKSGVSSGEKKLTYQKTRQLMETYPLDHLEFEVLFVEAENKS
jgi:malonyl-CoA O-methyltransferase